MRTAADDEPDLVVLDVHDEGLLGRAAVVPAAGGAALVVRRGAAAGAVVGDEGVDLRLGVLRLLEVAGTDIDGARGRVVARARLRDLHVRARALLDGLDVGAACVRACVRASRRD